MTPSKKFDFIAKSAIICSEKPTKGLETIAAPNPHQMNRIKGYLPDGTPVLVAQRPGRGGMDFTKIMGGKVFAVAADALSPVYEKDENEKGDKKGSNAKAENKTRKQKFEDGLPLFSSSGFYLMSSKEYPALHMFEAYTLLQERGSRVLILTEEQMAKKQRAVLTSEFDLEVLLGAFEEMLADSNNLVCKYDEAVNKRRRRSIDQAVNEAEDAEETYTGVKFEELKTSKKDGNPFVYFVWESEGRPPKAGALMREASQEKGDKTFIDYYTATEAVDNFAKGKNFQAIAQALSEGRSVTLSYVLGHVMRTSVSFKRKIENVLAAPPEKQAYGDGVYIKTAFEGWSKALISVMYSQHPNFPQTDYDSLHYVVACRQAEIGMMKSGEKFSPPQGITYNLGQHLLK